MILFIDAIQMWQRWRLFCHQSSNFCSRPTQ